MAVNMIRLHIHSSAPKNVYSWNSCTNVTPNSGGVVVVVVFMVCVCMCVFVVFIALPLER
jgi:hypothetical protein